MNSAPVSRVELVPTPEHLLVHPCEVVGVGNTVESLAKGYIINTTCVGQYKSTLNGIKDYNKTIKDLTQQEDKSDK